MHSDFLHRRIEEQVHQQVWPWIGLFRHGHRLGDTQRTRSGIRRSHMQSCPCGVPVRAARRQARTGRKQNTGVDAMLLLTANASIYARCLYVFHYIDKPLDLGDTNLGNPLESGMMSVLQPKYSWPVAHMGPETLSVAQNVLRHRQKVKG